MSINSPTLQTIGEYKTTKHDQNTWMTSINCLF